MAIEKSHIFTAIVVGTIGYIYKILWTRKKQPIETHNNERQIQIMQRRSIEDVLNSLRDALRVRVKIKRNITKYIQEYINISKESSSSQDELKNFQRRINIFLQQEFDEDTIRTELQDINGLFAAAINNMDSSRVLNMIASGTRSGFRD